MPKNLLGRTLREVRSHPHSLETQRVLGEVAEDALRTQLGGASYSWDVHSGSSGTVTGYEAIKKETLKTSFS